ncbi:transporter [Advenella kashmirensis W13003]|uniref:Transporter n=1 Tax=Advenella kashmirensis W13003 TaxID=1424334 RepID=V8QL36_9BURK|nr:AEC family transporter [Advenella kashmirensis]ETF00671.1 transporter [Advenella kashmirensis W13003]
MNAVINAAFPVFALILVGFLAARTHILSEQASQHLNSYVVWLALPALLFHSMATVSWESLNQIPFILSSIGGMLATFIIFMVWQRRAFSLSDNSVASLSASYSNTGYMGLPLCMLAYGEAGITPVILSMILTACVLFALSIVCLEMGLQKHGSVWTSVRHSGMALLKNPLIISPLAGMALSGLGIPLPDPVAELARLLGSSASPCALVTIGLFLAQTRSARPHPALAAVLFMKMLFLPAITAVLAFLVFDMPQIQREAAVLLAALPIGTGPFMLASMYRRDTQLVSQSIFISTVLSVVSVSVLLALFHN